MKFSLPSVFAPLVLFAVSLMTVSEAAEPNLREKKVRGDKEKVEAEGFWIYNDLPAAYAEAKKTGKPIIVNFRCLPCTECVKLDDELVDADPVIRPLLEKFVRVRVVSTNGLDLNTFQFDTDQSFSVFFLNGDGVIYGRFGTRSHRTEWYGDVSLPGMAAAMQGALQLHAQYPANKASLAAKLGKPAEFASPEKFPSFKGKYTDKLNYEGDVVKSCIHCHQIGDALREYHRDKTGTMPNQLLAPYPHPKSLGLILDAETRGKVEKIVEDSVAADSVLKPGDEILTLSGQPILSIADVQWVFHNLGDSESSVEMTYQRAGQIAQSSLQLPDGWKDLDDISWRASSWPMRGMVTGGILLGEASEELRKENGIADDQMALRAKHVGQYNKHGAAKRAGVKKDDILVSYDGRTDLMTDSDVLRYGVRNKRVGDKVKIEVMRQGKRLSFTIPIQQ